MTQRPNLMRCSERRHRYALAIVTFGRIYPHPRNVCNRRQIAARLSLGTPKSATTTLHRSMRSNPQGANQLITPATLTADETGRLKDSFAAEGRWFSLHSCRWYPRIDIDPGETLGVDKGCIVAFQPTVSYDIQCVGKIKSALFGGEGLFIATLRGPGRIRLQPLPLSRMADRLYSCAPKAGGHAREEGALLGEPTCKNSIPAERVSVTHHVEFLEPNYGPY